MGLTDSAEYSHEDQLEKVVKKVIDENGRTSREALIGDRIDESRLKKTLFVDFGQEDSRTSDNTIDHQDAVHPDAVVCVVFIQMQYTE